ncbi:MAG: hypothetical protein HY952_10915 [Elusimicrobia bacterium]|nr:hypothetical protein [Elusimicrobiota bacterium]
MTKIYGSIAALGLMLAAGPAAAAGVAVDPSYVRITEVKLNGTVRLEKPAGYLLKILNREASPVVYTVSVVSCKEQNIKPNGGYEEFPDLKWFVFRSTEITVQAQGAGYLPYLELKAPKGKYINKRWQALVKVARKENGSISAEAVMPLWVETVTEKKPKKRSGEKKHGN